jgi:hypothetical protein
MHRPDLDAEGVREHGQAALALQGQQHPRQLGRAQHRRVGPCQADALEGLAQHAAVKGRVMGDHHPAAQSPLELGQHILRRGRAVDHRLGDAGEALDPAA